MVINIMVIGKIIKKTEEEYKPIQIIINMMSSRKMVNIMGKE